MKKYNYQIFSGGNQGRQKYDSNVIHQFLIRNFMRNLLKLIDQTNKKEIFEVGCGEGQILGVLLANGYEVSRIDYSEEAVEITKSNFKSIGKEINVKVGNIYDMNCFLGGMVLCCEVLEHLEAPGKAFDNLVKASDEYLLVSVPREPLWCILNFCRGKYWSTWGNTPGHINHWSKKKFIKLCKKYGKIVAVRSPIPWTMVLLKVDKNI